MPGCRVASVTGPVAPGRQVDVKQILIVEDNETLRELWADTVQGAGYQAVPAATAAEAFRMLHSLRPDLVLLDLVMPSMEMNGIELLARLHENPDWTHIPIVVISGIGESVDRQGAARLGVRSILSKPVELETILGEVRRLIDGDGPAPGSRPRPRAPRVADPKGEDRPAR